jgi:hypothetical protein
LDRGIPPLDRPERGTNGCLNPPPHIPAMQAATHAAPGQSHQDIARTNLLVSVMNMMATLGDARCVRGDTRADGQPGSGPRGYSPLCSPPSGEVDHGDGLSSTPTRRCPPPRGLVCTPSPPTPPRRWSPPRRQLRTPSSPAPRPPSSPMDSFVDLSGGAAYRSTGDA